MSDNLESSRGRLWTLVTASLNQEIERRRAIQSNSVAILTIGLAALAIAPVLFTSNALSRVVFTPPHGSFVGCILWGVALACAIGAVVLVVMVVVSLFRNLTFAKFMGLPSPHKLWEYGQQDDLATVISNLLADTVEKAIRENEKVNNERVSRLRRCSVMISIALPAMLSAVILFALVAVVYN